MTVHKNIKKRGFTLPELLAVMAIMAILAAVSSPFIRGYIRDAGNEKAKSTLRLIALGYKNFIYEYGTRTNDLSMSGRLSQNSDECPSIEDLSGALQPSFLIGCHYVSNISWEAYDKRYEFYVGAASQCCSEGPENAWACMKGIADEGDYKRGYCAWVTSNGTLDDNKEKEGTGT